MSLEAWGDEGFDGPEGYVTEEAYAEIEQERDRLKQHVADLQSGMYVNCVYCGYRYGPSDTTPVSKADMLKAHIMECKEHPMSELKAELELEKFYRMNAWIREMSLERFLNGVRVLWNIDEREYLSCINTEDREHFGDKHLSDAFFNNPHKTFVSLPDQDQRRVFAIIEKRTPTRKWPGEKMNDPVRDMRLFLEALVLGDPRALADVRGGAMEALGLTTDSSRG